MNSVNSTQTSQNVESETEANRFTTDSVIEGELLHGEETQESSNYAPLVRNSRQNHSQALVSDWFEIEESIAVCPDYLNTVKSGLDFLLRPYRLATLGILLFANGLLAGNYLMQLNAEKSVETAESRSEILASTPQTINPPTIESLAQPTAAPTRKTIQLSLNSLSTISPQPKKVNAHKSTTTSLTVASRPLNPAPQLSQSLIPYFIAPPLQQPVQTPSTIPAPTVLPPNSPAQFYIQAPAPTINSPTFSQSTKTQSVPVLAPPPTIPLAQNVDISETSQPESLSQEELAKQSIIHQELDRIRIEREDIPPLGFNHEYRLKMKALRTGEDIEQLRTRHYQLQQQAIPTTLE